MARGKKKETLTIEEKLEAALVPKDEQPYEVPENWCWTFMNSVAQWGSGGTPSRKHPEYYNGNIPWIKTGELNNGFICGAEEKITNEAIEHSGIKIYPINTVVIAMYGATIGKAGILMIEATTNQACACGVCSEVLDYQYLFYYACSQKDAFISKAKGGAQPNISQEVIKKHPIPLPPLAEQHRIVKRIESLFAQLDEAQDKAQEALDGFESRIAAILHQAFTGDLTVQQRTEKGLSKSDWQEVCLKEIVLGFKYGTSEKSDYSYSGIPVLRIPNIGEAGIDFADMKYLSDNNVDEESQIHENDILIIRSNGSRELVGKCALVPALDKEYAYASFLIRIQPTDKVRSDYLVLYLNSVDARVQMFAKAKSSAGIHNINSKELGAISLKLPGMWEQGEIVNQINRLLQKEKQAKEVAEQVVEQIDSVKKSILTKAFRGELGTNDPEDENAIELLKTVLDDRKES